jgi:hypothetical protein
LTLSVCAAVHFVHLHYFPVDTWFACSAAASLAVLSVKVQLANKIVSKATPASLWKQNPDKSVIVKASETVGTRLTGKVGDIERR